MKKLISTILVVAFVIIISACGNESGIAAQTGGATSVSPDAPVEETTEAETLPPIPQGDFSGSGFNILAACEQWQDFYVCDQTGEVVNDAVYNRNRIIEENYNIKLNYRVFNGYMAGMDSVHTALSGSVMGGSGDYDLLIGSVMYVTPYVPEGLYSDLNQNSAVQLDKSWWYQFVNGQIEIDGKLCLGAGGSGINTVAWSTATFFNKKLVENYSIENPYEIVKSGKWTTDKMKELGSVVLSDLDGNGKYDSSDRVGILSTNDYFVGDAGFYVGEVIAMGYEATEKTSDGGVIIKDINDKMISISEKLTDIVNSNVYLEGNNDKGLKNGVTQSHELYANMQKFFAGDGSLFMLHRLDFATWDTMREMENFGILPLAKYDENQSGYYTPTVADVAGIPAYVKDSEMSGVILEAMQYYSAESVKPAYFEMAIKRKSTRDEESVEMLEIIGNTLKCDFTYLYNRILNNTLPNITDKNFASKWAKNYDKAQKKIYDLVESVKGL